MFGKLYLESGFLYLGSTAKCVEATFLPATLNFTTPVNTYLSSTTTPLEGEAKLATTNTQVDTPFLGEVLVNGQNSKTLVGELSPSVTDACGNTYTAALYGEQDTYIRKVTQRYVPSSLYSGKMRLFVQSLYGSLRKDYYIYLGISGLPDTSQYKLILEGYVCEWGLPTVGLFTTSSYSYYLMEVSVTSITFKKLRLSTEARKWATILNTHPNKGNREFSSRVEAYILSTAHIDQNFTPVVRSTGVTCPGTPMGYGFKFNWKGNKAKIVLHDLEAHSPGNNYSRTVELTITDDLNVTGSVSAAKVWANGTNLQFWTPNHSERFLVSFGDVNGHMTNTSACPMYGYYDYNDTWIEFNFSLSVSNTNVSQAIPGLTQSNFTGYGDSPPSGVDGDYLSGANIPYGTVSYSFAGEGQSFQYVANATLQSRQGSRLENDEVYYTPIAIGASQTAPFGSGLVNDYLCDTQEYGNAASYLLSAYPEPPNNGSGQVDCYYYYEPVNAVYSIGVKNFSNSFPSTDTIEFFTKPVVGGACWLWYDNFAVYSSYSDVANLMCAVPLDDAEALVYGFYTSRSWSEKQTALARHDCLLAGVYGAMQNQSYTYDYLHNISVVTSATRVALRQTVVGGSGSTNVTLYNIAYAGAGGSSATSVKYHTSGKAGHMSVLSDGYTVLSEATGTPSPSTNATKYFIGSDTPGQYTLNLVSRASANGANILHHEEPTSPSENGFPDGVASAVGWV